MIFPYAAFENKVQVYEKFRIDASKTFSPNETITKIEFSVDANTYDITAKKFIDFAFLTSGTKVCQIEAFTATTSQIFAFNVEVLTKVEEKLLSEDQDFFKHQHDIYKYLPDSRNNFNYAHRRALEIILADLDEQGYVNEDQTKISIDQIKDISEFKELSIYTALRLIFKDFSNVKDDFNEGRSKYYGGLESSAKFRCVQRIDLNKDGIISQSEVRERTTIRVRRT